MAENTFKTNTFKKPEKEKKAKSGKKSSFSFGFFKDPRFILTIGFFLIIVSLFLLTAFVSYIFTGKADQSVIEALTDTSLVDSGKDASNWLGLYGAITSHYMIFRWLGISAFFMPPLLFFLGFRLVFKRDLVPLFSAFIFSVFAGLWLSLLLGYITHSLAGVTEVGFLSGGLGYELAKISDGLFGWGTFLILVLTLFVFIIYYFNVTAINAFHVRDPKPMGNEALLAQDEKPESTYTDDQDNWPKQDEEIPGSVLLVNEPVVEKSQPEIKLEVAKPKNENQPARRKELDLIVEDPKSDTDKLAEKLVGESGVYDPTLDLSDYRFPPLELLNEYEPSKVQVTPEELNANKDKIVATLTNFKIGISSIKATIGPTVTLYEIVPEAGIKISRIKNLEDDIALSLAALGIRIIAPIPGKGTIGIEVPNKNREMVSIRSVLSSQTFAKSDKELPVALGKTISNELFIIDLTKMPHLLVAGATGQGKSVGLNVILTS
ncbi:MAG: DNA translocase FtsK 4TM domain-containing protein, partial [Bacteroidetes bacterium]|nr:DNA translocase FtsK 4TM domain-containing protein [Bacteroidota bacterium]